MVDPLEVLDLTVVVAAKRQLLAVDSVIMAVLDKVSVVRLNWLDRRDEVARFAPRQGLIVCTTVIKQQLN